MDNLQPTAMSTALSADDATKPQTTQMNTARPRSPKQNKTKNQKVDKPVQTPTSRPSLFHDQLSSEIGQRLLKDTSGLDPINVLNRLTRSSSLPNLQQPTTANVGHARPQIPEPRLTSSSKSSASSREQTKLPKYDGYTFTLDHFAAISALHSLITKHGRISHMGILDPSYSFFMNKLRTAALYYKVKNKIAVVGGDPLCGREQWPDLLSEFSRFRKKHGLGIAYLGATQEFAEYALEQKGWVSMRFGTERALNPMTNLVLFEKEGKRIVKQNKQLLDPKRGNMKIDIYVPSQKQDLGLQEQLVQVYDRWRQHRNESGKPQAYITVFDPFALPHLMVYIYSSGPDGKPNGFAALRRTDATGGYHIDPYCALPDAPKGTSDLLIYAALALLNRAGIPYLGLGFEPAAEMTEMRGLSSPMARIIKSAYRRAFSRLPIAGKKAYHDKWHPDEQLDAGLYIIYPCRPDLHHSLATMHFANVSARQIMRAELKDQIKKLSLHVKKKPTVKEKCEAERVPCESASGKNSTESASQKEAVPMYSIYTAVFNVSKVSLHIGASKKVIS